MIWRWLSSDAGFCFQSLTHCSGQTDQSNLNLCVFFVSQVWSNAFPPVADSRHPPNLCWGGDQGQHHKALWPGRHSHRLLRLSTSASEHEWAHGKEVSLGLFSSLSSSHSSYTAPELVPRFHVAFWNFAARPVQQRLFCDCDYPVHIQVVSVCSERTGL